MQNLRKIFIFCALITLLTGCRITLPTPYPDFIPIPEDQIDRNLNVGTQIEQAYSYSNDVRDIWYVLWPLFRNKDSIGSLAYADYLGTFIDTPGLSQEIFSGKEDFRFLRNKMILSVFFSSIRIATENADLKSIYLMEFDTELETLSLASVKNIWTQTYPDNNLESLCDFESLDIHKCQNTLTGKGFIYTIDEIIHVEESAIDQGFMPEADVNFNAYRYKHNWDKWR